MSLILCSKLLLCGEYFSSFSAEILGEPIKTLIFAVKNLNWDDLEHEHIKMETFGKTKHRNELVVLEETFNFMIDQLLKANREAKASELRLRQVIDLVPHFILPKTEKVLTSWPIRLLLITMKQQ